MTNQRLVKRLLAGVILAMALANPVSAKTTTSITVNEPFPVMGGQITFTIVIDKNKDCTNKSQCGFVKVACYQDVLDADGLPQPKIVWTAGPATIAEARSPGFTLGLGIGGPATCNAEIDNYHFGTVYATTTFTAAG